MTKKIDSLNRIIELNQKVTSTLLQVGLLMDSIDNNRDLIRLNLEDEDPSGNYIERMRELNQYIIATSRKIKELEKNIHENHHRSSEYLKLVERFKEELLGKTQEVSDLKREMEEVRVRNVQLESITEEQEAQIIQQNEMITEKEKEINRKDDQIVEIGNQSQKSQADAYYKTAEVMELAAQRTKLAPRKKRETLREALELYRKSFQYGNSDAKQKINDLERQLVKS